MPYDKREPFSFTLPNNLPISGAFDGFNITQDANGHSVIDFGNLFDSLFGGLGGASTTGNTSTSTSSFPFSFLGNLKRDEKLVARDPFSFTLPNRLPISGAFDGFNVTEDANGNSVINFGNLFGGLGGLLGGSSTGNTTTSTSSFPFSFLNNLKRDEKLVARDPFSFTLPNRLPISGAFDGFNVTEDANGNSVINFGNLFGGLGGLLGGSSSTGNTTSTSSFPFSFLNNLKRDEQLVARDPFSFTLPNRLPISGAFDGFNVTEDANGNSVINFGNLFGGLGGLLGGSSTGNTTSSTSSFPFSFLNDFKREL